MQLDVHQVYPGVALAVLGPDSALFGAPADAFKAVKQYCMTHNLPFPRTLVAPQTLVANEVPQYNPEFFLYDFLFVYGAAFRPDLMDERLMLVLDEDQVVPAIESLRMTLMGPTYEDISGYADPNGERIVDDTIARFLSGVSAQMAIKQGDKPRAMDTIVSTITFDQANKTAIFGGEVTVERTGPTSFTLGTGIGKSEIDIDVPKRVKPFSVLEQTSYTQYPSKFAIKPLGVRSGFDLSGPCTGFLFWINGRIVMYDGPVGTGFLLEQHGISFGDIDAVILSHCHEDHMGAFVELMLSGRRPRLYTTEVIYHSALIKLSTYLGIPLEDAARYLDYHRIEHQQPFDLLGAKFKIFYTVHAIPTVGIEIKMNDDSGQEHTIVVSGDTLHHEGLEKLRAENIVDPSFID
ncbi:MAG: MBL fold metallo-hydrolase [Myxococcota bacterium]|nr:MBL fold metallo-hydrolase [Myxococcota bacterium]